jgi:hypothetical protein
MKTSTSASFLGLALLTSGCLGYQIPIAGESWDGLAPPQPGQEVAVQIVWNQVYGMEDRVSPPPILWHFNDRCATDPGAPNTFKAPHSNDCAFGYYQPTGIYAPSEFEAPNRIDVEWNGFFSSYETFAHELCHAYMAYTTGDADDGHTGPCFAHGGVRYIDAQTAPGSLVYLANQALIAWEKTGL